MRTWLLAFRGRPVSLELKSEKVGAECWRGLSSKGVCELGDGVVDPESLEPERNRREGRAVGRRLWVPVGVDGRVLSLS